MRVFAKLIGMPRKERVPAYVEPATQETESGLAMDVTAGATVRDLRDELARRTPEVDLVVDKVLVNGRDAGLDTTLQEGDSVVFFGPVANRE